MRRRPGTEVPSTISNKDWARLQNRARKANAHLDELADPRAIKHRKQSAEQLRQVAWN